MEHILLWFILLGVTGSPTGVQSLSSKDWWVKPLSPELSTAGYLTMQQLKMAVDAGFKTVISLYPFSMNASLGDDEILSSEQMQQFAVDVTGIKYDILISQLNSSWISMDVVDGLAHVMSAAERPVLLHCQSGYRSSFIAFAYLLRELQSIPDASERVVEITKLYQRVSALGYDYHQRQDLAALIKQVRLDGYPEDPLPQDLDLIHAKWYLRGFWALKPIYKEWYIMGQITTANLADETNALFYNVINLRRGVQHNGQPSQEEVSLINIQDNTGTYKDGGRQSLGRLNETVIDPSKPNAFISPSSQYNFQMTNSLEFGDDVGYNETQERMALEDSGFEYLHVPVGKLILLKLTLLSSDKFVCGKVNLL